MKFYRWESVGYVVTEDDSLPQNKLALYVKEQLKPGVHHSLGVFCVIYSMLLVWALHVFCG